jgi:hypothetical protein
MPVTEHQPTDTLYVRNAGGGVIACTRAHFDKYLCVLDEEGNSYTRHGYKLLNEGQARAARPQLFGKLDPQIMFTDDELVRAATRRKLLDELFPEDAKAHADTLSRMMSGGD